MPGILLSARETTSSSDSNDISKTSTNKRADLLTFTLSRSMVILSTVFNSSILASAFLVSTGITFEIVAMLSQIDDITSAE